MDLLIFKNLSVFVSGVVCVVYPVCIQWESTVGVRCPVPTGEAVRAEIHIGIASEHLLMYAHFHAWLNSPRHQLEAWTPCLELRFRIVSLEMFERLRCSQDSVANLDEIGKSLNQQSPAAPSD